MNTPLFSRTPPNPAVNSGAVDPISRKRIKTLQQRMAEMLCRIAYPERGSNDEIRTLEEFAQEIRTLEEFAQEIRTLEEFAQEIQDTFHRADIDENYDGAPSGHDRQWPQAENE